MSIKKIKQHNNKEFLDDLKKISEVMVYADRTGSFFKTTKRELKKDAESRVIRYYITDKVFVRRRNVMVVL